MKVFFSAGEPSGDIHGANLIRALQKQCPDVRCAGFGGGKMRAAGCDVHFDLTTLAVMWRETGSIKWPVFSFLFNTAVAFTVAVLVYQIGRLF